MDGSGRSWRRQREMATIKIYHMHSLEFLIRKIQYFWFIHQIYYINIYIKNIKIEDRPSANNEAL